MEQSPQSPIDWDRYFILQAMIASYRSKDPRSKVGCVFVDENNRQIAMGYNGAVSGIDESKVPWIADPSLPKEMQKYGYVVHAEANAILHASKSLANSKLYVSLFPCNECAKLIASLKVKEVIYLSDKNAAKIETVVAKRILDLCEIPYRQVRIDAGLINNIHSYLQEIAAS